MWLLFKMAKGGISIHALLAESDSRQTADSIAYIRFLSTLSLRRATWLDRWRTKEDQFLSTLSLRRATGCQRPCERPTRDFYPRSPCGERPDNHAQSPRQPNFYPRSPCGERLDKVSNQCKIDEFLSTLSLRRATRKGLAMRWNTCISIHALLAESDPPSRNRER